MTRNELLRAARERLPSTRDPGEPLTPSELAEKVNAWLWAETGQRYELDGHHISKYERGVVRYPIAAYRSGLRAVLGAATDVELGFLAPSRRRTRPADLALAGQAWAVTGILDASAEATRWVVLSRRDALTSGLAATGAAVLGPLAAGRLEPLIGWTTRGARFSAAEVDALERVVVLFRGWRSAALGPSAVVGQLSDITDRLRGAGDDPLTRRVFLAAAELAKVAASMYYDEGAYSAAQRFYVLAVQLAVPAREISFAASVLAAMARQSFDLGATRDGLDLVELARSGTRNDASPRLRTMLATRQAWGHAMTGEVYAFRRAVDAAEQSFVDAGPVGAEPHWLAGLDAAELAGVIGARFRDLSHHDPVQAPRAVEYIGRALALRDSSRTRNRLFDLIGLARAHVVTGEPERGCELVAQALPLVDPVHLGRVGRKLGDFCREVSRYETTAVVRRTRDRVRELVTTG